MGYAELAKMKAPEGSNVIADLDNLLSSSLNFNVDALRLGIDRIFHQFFNHRGRPFNHLTRSDFMHHAFRQNFYSGSHFTFFLGSKFRPNHLGLLAEFFRRDLLVIQIFFQHFQPPARAAISFPILFYLSPEMPNPNHEKPDHQ